MNLQTSEESRIPPVEGKLWTPVCSPSMSVEPLPSLTSLEKQHAGANAMLESRIKALTRPRPGSKPLSAEAASAQAAIWREELRVSQEKEVKELEASLASMTVSVTSLSETAAPVGSSAASSASSAASSASAPSAGDSANNDKEEDSDGDGATSAATGDGGGKKSRAARRKVRNDE